MNLKNDGMDGSQSSTLSRISASFRRKKKRNKGKSSSRRLSTPIIVGGRTSTDGLHEHLSSYGYDEDSKNGHFPLYSPSQASYDGFGHKITDNSPRSIAELMEVDLQRTNDMISRDGEATCTFPQDIDIYLRKIHSLEHGSNNLKEALKQVLSSKKLCDAEIKSLNIEVEALKVENANLAEALSEEKNVSASLGLGSVTELRQENKQLHQELEETAENSRNTTQQMLQVRADLHSEKEENQILCHRISEIEASKKLIEVEKTALEEKHSFLFLENEKMKEELISLRNKEEDSLQKVKNLTTKLYDSQSSVVILKSKLDILEHSLSEVQAEKKSEDELHLKSEIDKILEECENSKRQMSTDLNIARFELNIARNDLNEMKISKANTSCELEDALDENRKLLVQLEKEKERVSLIKGELKNEFEKVAIEKEDLKVKVAKMDSESTAFYSLKLDYDLLKSNYSICKTNCEMAEKKLKENTESELKWQEMESKYDATLAQLQAARDNLAENVIELKLMKEENERERKTAQYVQNVKNFDLSLKKATTRYSTAELLATNDIQENMIEDLQKQLSKQEGDRRQMLNLIQELKGNIRVYVRVRPFIDDEKESQESALTICHNDDISAVNDISGEQHHFSFDKVFTPSDGQDVIFENIVDYVQSAIDGYSVCIFSYGMTGAGKTYTMLGIGNDNCHKGIIPRTIEYIDMNTERICQGGQWSMTIYGSCFEIYNEQIKDLCQNFRHDSKDENKVKDKCMKNIPLITSDMEKITMKKSTEKKSPASNARISRIPISPTSSLQRAVRLSSSPQAAQTQTLSPSRFKSPSSNEKNGTSKNRVKINHGERKTPTKLVIKKDQKGKTYVDGLTRIKFEANKIESDFCNLIDHASKVRSVGSTKFNAQSSRSHAIFLIEIELTNNKTGETLNGTLHFCDLAGNEKFDGITASIQKKEIQSINKSLSCLGDVFHALGQGSTHVPYRNSKLTYLLESCLSGEGKALMIGNVSPSSKSSYDSITTLRFVQRASKIELGRATKNITCKAKGTSKKRNRLSS